MEKLENIDEYYTGKAWKDVVALQVLEACLHLDREKKDARKDLKLKPWRRTRKSTDPKSYATLRLVETVHKLLRRT